MAYDIIGDIHGYADRLEALLWKLGYRNNDGVWRHPERTAIFVGDFVDRGPQQLRTVAIVRSMVEAGAAKAVMGNHELNAVAWHTPLKDEVGNTIEGEFLRPHTEKNDKQTRKFLDELAKHPEQQDGILDWFMTLPLWLDLPGIRVVHACWHPALMDRLRPWLTAEGCISRERLAEATTRPSPDAGVETEVTIFHAVETITKGLEIPLPAGHSFRDKDGHTRHEVRVRWWDTNAVTYAEAALMDEEALQRLPRDLLIPAQLRFVPPTDKPIFFGHYWLQGTPTVQSPQAACLDYSVAKGGELVAYRWDGESSLNSDNLFSA